MSVSSGEPFSGMGTHHLPHCIIQVLHRFGMIRHLPRLPLRIPKLLDLLGGKLREGLSRLEWRGDQGADDAADV